MERVLRNEQEVEKEPGRRRALSVQASLMTPVQPMLVRLLLSGPTLSRCSDLPCEIWGGTVQMLQGISQRVCKGEGGGRVV